MDNKDKELESGEPPVLVREEITTVIPNGGLVAWLQCASSFCLFFNSWGIVNTFGVFQTFYEQDLLQNESSSNISWVGSIQGFLLVFLGIIVGPLFDHGYLHALLFVGTVSVTFGMMMTSLCTAYWQVVLAQGIMVGLGCGCLFVPSVAILPSYFSTRKALAMGIGASGSSLGGIIYPIIFRRLQPRIGFPWTTRLIAFIMLGTLVIPLVLTKTRRKPSSQWTLIDLAAWRELPYLLFGIGLFCTFMGLYIPFFYVQTYVIRKEIMDENLGFYLLAILNAGSVLGRIVLNYVADKIGPLNVCIACGIATSVLGFAWIGIESFGGVIVFSVLYGFFSGPLVSLPPAVVVTLSPHPGVIGIRLGMLFVPIAFGLLIGNPIAGAILRSGAGNNWVALEAFCGSSVLLSVGFIGAARVAKVGWRIEKLA